MASTGFPARYRFQWVREAVLPLVALALSIALPFPYLVDAFVITGQAHFLITYVYQYRGGRMDRVYLFAALSLALAGIAYFVLSGSTLPILFFTAAIFSAHFARDEFTLHDEPLTWEHVSTLVGFVFIFTLTLVTAFLPGWSWVLYAAVGLTIAAIILRIAFGRTAPSNAELYLWLVEFIAFLAGVVRHLPSSILAIIILLHFANWYIGYGLRIASRPDRARRYWMDVAWTLALSIVLFALFAYGVPYLSILFLVGPFYAWTVAHIVLSYVASRARR